MNRREKLFQILSSAEEPQTALMLAMKMGISERTVRTLISDIMNDADDNNKIISGKKGYSLEKGATIKATENGDIKNDSKEYRVTYIMQKLLLSNDYVKLNDFADEMFLSSASINRIIRTVREILEQYHLTLIQKPCYGVKIVGTEENRRICYTHICIENNKNDIAAAACQCDLSTDDYFKVSYIVKKVLYETGYKLTKEGIENIVFHLMCGISRVLKGNYIENIPKEYESETRVDATAQKIIEMISKEFNICFPEPEKDYLCIHLLGKSANVSTEEIVISANTEKIIHEANEKIKKNLGYDFSHDFELFSMLAVHIEPMMIRLKYRLRLSNPMVDEIKTKYVDAYECAVIAAEHLREEHDLVVPDDEIAYLAMHYGLAIRRLTQGKDEKRFLIICGSGISTAMILKKKIEREFETQSTNIVISDVLSVEKIDLTSYDYLVSTVPLPYKVPQKVIYVENILSDVSLKELVERKKYCLLKHFDDDLIFLNEKFTTREEILQFLCGKFQMKNQLGMQFTESVLKRETLSSTAIGNLVAIPHTMGLYVPETKIAVMTLIKSVLWGKRKVKVIVLIAYAKQDLQIISEMNEHLMDILMNVKTVNQIISAKNLNELKTIFE